MSMTFVTPEGLEHGLINTLGNSVPDDGFKRFAEKDRPKMEKQKKEDERIVEAQYLHKDGIKDNRPERLERPYMNWAGQPITMWRFLHGHVYKVPKGLVDDVNSPHKRTKKRTGLIDSKGQPLLSDQVSDPVHRFVAVGF
jgi:hypothetical protein